jgi:hypothetical protein
MISCHFDKFHDFLTSFAFYTNLKQMDHKFSVMFREQNVQNFWSVLINMNINFAFIVFYYPSDL